MVKVWLKLQEVTLTHVSKLSYCRIDIFYVLYNSFTFSGIRVPMGSHLSSPGYRGDPGGGVDLLPLRLGDHPLLLPLHGRLVQTQGQGCLRAGRGRQQVIVQETR